MPARDLIKSLIFLMEVTSIDKKKVVITEATIRDALRLDDPEGVDCLPNKEIFVELARMGYEKPSTKLTFYKAFFSSQWKSLVHTILQSLSAKRTSWNEFSSAIAFAVICLSTGQNFNFSKYIFESLVRNIDRGSKFYMCPRFIQLIIQNQLGDLSTHTTTYTSPALTQKVFANMRRVRKGFLGVETPLFEGMLVAGEIEEQGDAEEQVQDDIDDAVAQGADTAVKGDVVHEPSIPSPTPPTPPPQQSQDLPSTSQEALDACAALTRRVEHLEIESSDDNEMEDASNQGRITDVLMVDKEDEKKTEEAMGAGDDQVKGRQADIYKIDMNHASKVLSMQEDEPEVQEVVDVVTTAKLITEVVTASIRVVAASTRRRKGVVIRDPEEESTAIIPADTKSKDKGKGIMVEKPKPIKKKQQVEMDEEYQVMKKRPQTEAQARRNMITYLKNVAGFRLDYFKGMSYDDIQIVPDEDDDVYTEATPLARKVPVVDYEIIHFNNKPHYKIIHANGTHQLRYPLSRFKLDQMLHAVRLRVEEQSEMALELLRTSQDIDEDSDGMNVEGDEEANKEDDADELYRDVNINLEGQQQSSSVLSRFVSNMRNPGPDTCIDFIFDSTPQIDVLVTTAVEPPLLSATTLPPPTISIIPHMQQTPTPSPANVPSSSLQDLPNFGSLIGFNHRLKTLETNFSKFMQTNQFAKAVSSIPEDNRGASQGTSLQDFAKNEKTINEQLEAEVLTRSSNSSKTSYALDADLSELELKKILIEKIETNKSIYRFDEQKNLYKALVDAYECEKLILDTYGDTITLKRRQDDYDKDKEPSAGSNQGSKRRREGKEPESTSAPKENTSKTSGKSTEGSKSQHKIASESTPAEEQMHTIQDLKEPAPQEFETDATDDQPVEEASQHPHCNLAKKADSRTLFKLMDTPVDFSPFVMNRLKVDTLTPELLAGPTYKLMKGSCKSLVELEFFLEEFYKATTDQLDWNNPEGQQYLLKPLPLIPNSRGYFSITSSTMTLNLVPHTMWSQVPVSYDKHALWGISHWGHKRQQFYVVVNKESARDVYSKRRIIAVTELQIVEWNNYKHLDWITVRRDDDKLYKLKKLNLTKLDTYKSDLKRKEAYTAYSNPIGFIYQNKDKQNRLMRIDELHNFSEDTLNDVQTALDDRLKGIRMQYLRQTIWRQSDKDRATAMIQAIDK
nr:hypothetical protein [Tanacetum cinerariifolium]